jgi:hypothetical protein
MRNERDSESVPADAPCQNRTLPVSRPAGRRDRSERAPSDTRRPDSHPARARASGVGYTGCWVRPAVRFYVRLSAVRLCPVLCPAVRFYVRLSGSMSGCPVLCPAVRFYVRLSGSMSGCLVLCPAVRFYVRLSGSMPGCPVLCPAVRLSGYMFGCPAVRLYVRLSGCSACVRIGHGSRIRCAADPTACVTCGWAGVDKTSRVGFSSDVEKARKWRRIPLVKCTLCSAAFCRTTKSSFLDSTPLSRLSAKGGAFVCLHIARLK